GATTIVARPTIELQEEGSQCSTHIVYAAPIEDYCIAGRCIYLISTALSQYLPFVLAAQDRMPIVGAGAFERR
ncbi:hypothetical protein, partial [Collinsella bouchesdurhonensis]|uniref:hypothetical protein n=1 Tax=Collinsella bouchesdurhonensis TaxID=1907654 RepID=UPI0034A4F8E7